MKRRAGLGVALGFLAAIALAGTTRAAFTGLINGGFETGTFAGGVFQQLDAPNTTSIDGWSVDAGSVDWVGSYWLAPVGVMSIDMSGAVAGTLSQTFETVIGNTYTVSFQLSGNPDGDPAIKTLEVSATGGVTGVYTHDTTGSDLTSMVWTPQTYEFLATSASTTLTFASTTNTPFGPAIDDVAVTEDVAVKEDCKQGGWVSMLDTAGNSFKNQGDCVSFFATKGKNPGAIPPAAPADASAVDTAAAATHGKANKPDKVTGKKKAEEAKAKNQNKSQGSNGHGSKGKKTK